MTEYKPPTARDLLAKLGNLSPQELDQPVVLAKDEEGNGFEFWGGDVDQSLIDENEKDTTWQTPEQWAKELENPNSRFDPEDDAPPEIGDGIMRVIVLWP